ncbi:prepilin-type cleavage/methylation domain-containing protein [Pseudorhodoferax aquiterrae]|nr:prepilin-type cleavage/methylation domain-containing protein [Pseudorhodoferax aquiterrae]
MFFQNNQERLRGKRRILGFTIVELLVGVVVVGILISLAIPYYRSSGNRQKNQTAITDITVMAVFLQAYHMDYGRYPDELPADFQKLDPWGNPYQYLPIEGSSVGERRKDKSLVPINTDFDLYSMGPDGRSVGPLTASASRDDIVRAANGRFIGVAVDF